MSAKEWLWQEMGLCFVRVSRNGRTSVQYREYILQNANHQPDLQRATSELGKHFTIAAYLRWHETLGTNTEVEDETTNVTQLLSLTSVLLLPTVPRAVKDEMTRIQKKERPTHESDPGDDYWLHSVLASIR
jgi:hypothetical protein